MPMSCTAAPSVVSPSPTPTPSASTSPRNLLRRLKSKTASLACLRSSRRILQDFHIRLADPHRVYSPNDLVAGSVCVSVDRPVAVTHLVVALIGRIDVYGPGHRPDTGGRKWGKGKHGSWDDDAIRGEGQGVTTCRDEMVLCGEGRLEPGTEYQFGFELEFLRPDSGGGGKERLPTSLDFQKGSISYTVVATLTRPPAPSLPAQNPRSTCSAKISFIETIDIAHLPPPKPQIICLEPLARRKNQKAPRSRSPATHSSPGSSDGNLAAPDTPTSKHGSRDKDGKPPITATVQLQKSGALPGDTLPVKITIAHTKKIRSLNGIILTLHRQTRFDPPTLTTASSITSVSSEPLKKALTPASSSLKPLPSAFRKDLAQTICPLIVDPKTLTCRVTANVRVPDDAFPTIRDVPGNAVEFRYFVEVVLDLGGKLASGLGSALDAKTSQFDCVKSSSAAGTGISVEGGVMVETQRVRREKGVVAARFEVVVGSVDSVAGNGKGAALTKGLPSSSHGPPQVVVGSEEDAAGTVAQARDMLPHEGDDAPEYHQNDPYWRHSLRPRPATLRAAGSPCPSSSSHPASAPSTPVPPPPPPLQAPELEPEPVDEKERYRRREEALLPSAPPPGDPSSSAFPSGPSAPPLEFEGVGVAEGAEGQREDEAYAEGAYQEGEYERYGGERYAPTAPPPGVVYGHYGEYGDSGGGPSAPPSAPDDKAEAERRRLLAEQSAPPEDAGAGTGASAPALGAMDGGQDAGEGLEGLGEGEELPVYSRR